MALPSIDSIPIVSTIKQHTTASVASVTAKAAAAQETAKNVAANAANAASTASGAVAGLQNQASGIIGNVMNQAGSLTNMASSALSGAQASLGNLAKFASSGITSTSFLNLPPDFAKLAFDPTNPNFLDPNKKNNTSLGNFSSALGDKLGDFNSALQGITGSLQSVTGNLQKQGLSFIASTTSKMIDGIDLPGLDSLGSFANFGLGQLGKLASMGGDALKSVGDGLKAVTTTLGNVYEAGKAALNTVTTAVTQTVGSVLGPVANIAQTAYALTDPRLAKSLVQANTSFLPPTFQVMLGNAAQNAMASVTGDVHNKIGGILNKAYALDNVLTTVDANGLLGSVRGTSGGSGFIDNGYNISGYGGSYLYGQSSFTGSYTSYGSLYDSIKTLCGDQGLYFSSYSDDRDLFDMLLAALMQTNAGQLLKGLLECAQDNGYATGRSTNIARQGMTQVANKGDVMTYTTLVKELGSDVIKNQEEDLLALYVNAHYDRESKRDLDQLLTSLDMTKSDLVKSKDIAGHTVLDSAKITLLQKADTAYQSEFLTKEEYAAINAALALFGTEGGIIRTV